MKHGFELMIKGKYHFFVTERKRRTENLADEIAKTFVNLGYDIPNNPSVRKEIMWYANKATLEDGVNDMVCVKGTGDNRFTMIIPKNELIVVEL